MDQKLKDLYWYRIEEHLRLSQEQVQILKQTVDQRIFDAVIDAAVARVEQELSMLSFNVRKLTEENK